MNKVLRDGTAKVQDANIQCLKMEKNSSEDSTFLEKGCHVQTRILSNSYTFKWTIENVSKLCTNAKIRSPEFHPASDVRSSFYLNVNKSDLELKLTNFSSRLIDVHLDISLIDYTGCIIQSWNVPTTTTENIFLGNFLRIKLESLKGDVVTVNVNMVFGQNDYVSHVYQSKMQTSNQMDQINHLNDLSFFESDSKEQLVSDVVSLQVIHTNYSTPVPRKLLSQKSAVFAKIVQQMSKNNKSITIDDLEINTVELLVSFLYTGMVFEDDLSTLCSLYDAGVKYEIPDLIRQCRALIQTKISAESVFEILLFADRHKDEVLKESSIRYLITYSKFSFASTHWLSFVKSSVSLAQEVLAAYVRERKSNPPCAEKTQSTSS